jgi:hypothetical protein
MGLIQLSVVPLVLKYGIRLIQTGHTSSQNYLKKETDIYRIILKLRNERHHLLPFP